MTNPNEDSCPNYRSATPWKIMQRIAKEYSINGTTSLAPVDIINDPTIKISTTQLYAVCTKLIDDGMIKKIDSDHRKNSYYCALTEKGHRCLKCWVADVTNEEIPTGTAFPKNCRLDWI